MVLNHNKNCNKETHGHTMILNIKQETSAHTDMTTCTFISVLSMYYEALTLLSVSSVDISRAGTGDSWLRSVVVLNHFRFKVPLIVSRDPSEKSRFYFYLFFNTFFTRFLNAEKK